MPHSPTGIIFISYKNPFDKLLSVISGSLFTHCGFIYDTSMDTNNQILLFDMYCISEPYFTNTAIFSDSNISLIKIIPLKKSDSVCSVFKKHVCSQLSNYKKYTMSMSDILMLLIHDKQLSLPIYKLIDTVLIDVLNDLNISVQTTNIIFHETFKSISDPEIIIKHKEYSSDEMNISDRHKVLSLFKLLLELLNDNIVYTKFIKKIMTFMISHEQYNRDCIINVKSLICNHNSICRLFKEGFESSEINIHILSNIIMNYKEILIHCLSSHNNTILDFPIPFKDMAVLFSNDEVPHISDDDIDPEIATEWNVDLEWHNLTLR